jgi:hypothetical protein
MIKNYGEIVAFFNRNFVNLNFGWSIKVMNGQWGQEICLYFLWSFSQSIANQLIQLDGTNYLERGKNNKEYTFTENQLGNPPFPGNLNFFSKSRLTQLRAFKPS